MQNIENINQRRIITVYTNMPHSLKLITQYFDYKNAFMVAVLRDLSHKKSFNEMGSTRTESDERKFH